MTNQDYEELQHMADRTKSWGAPPGNKDLSMWAQTATGQQASPESFPAQAKADEIAAKHKDVLAQLDEATTRTADLRQKVMVPAKADLGAFDHFTTSLTAGFGPNPWELVEPLWNDLTWWASSGFTEAGRWKSIEVDIDRTQKLVNRIWQDGNPRHSSVPSGWPGTAQGVPEFLQGNTIEYDWNTPSGRIYRSQIKHQVDALTAFNNACNSLNDAVGAVATFTAFLAAAALALFGALAAFASEWIAEILAMLERGEALLAEVTAFTGRLAQLAARLRELQGWYGAGRVAAWVIDQCVAAIRFVQGRLQNAWEVLTSSVENFLRTILPRILNFVLGAAAAFGISLKSTLYAIDRATNVVRKVNNDNDPSHSDPFGTGHWPNPCIDLAKYKFPTPQAGKAAGRGGSQYLYEPFGQDPGGPPPLRTLP